MGKRTWKRLLKPGPLLAAALLCAPAGQAAPLAIPDVPVFLRSLGVDPNLILTLDDSASMMSAFLPDDWRVYPASSCYPSCLDVTYGGTTYGVKYAAANRYKAASFNAMYYDPSVVYKIPTRPDGVTYTTSFTSARKNGFASTSTTVDLSSQYRAQIDYTNGTGVDYTTDSSGVQAYYYLFFTDAGVARPTTCTATTADQPDDDNCYVRTNVSATSGNGLKDLNADGTINASDKDERQNFANWYSFYRTRTLATMTAAMQAMGQVRLDELRFGWQTLNCSESSTNCCNTLPNSGSYNCKARNSTTNFDNRIRSFNSAQRTNFLNWLEKAAPPAPSSDTGTPLLTAMVRAGEYFKSTGVNSPYAEDPQVSAGTAYSCRRNFHLLMTDGIWNDNPIPFTGGNVDNASATLPDGTTYSPRAPYRDSDSATLADIAMAYWRTDLLNGGTSDNLSTCTGATCNSLLPYRADGITPASLTTDAQIRDYIYWNPKNDPATWQHMTNFTVSLGLSGVMTDPAWGGSTYSGDYPALVDGDSDEGKQWPSLNASSDDPNKVYDLWHAAINSRGKFFSADDPDSLGAAFGEILDTISAMSSPSGGAGLSSTSTQADNGGPIFEATNDANWSGRLQARAINSDYTLGSVLWDAGQSMPTSPSRKVFTLNDLGSSTALTAANCAGALDTALGSNPTTGTDDGNWCARRVNWLRGDARVTNATCSAGTLTLTSAGHGFIVGDKVTVSGIVTGTTESTRYNGAFEVSAALADTFTLSISAGCETPTYASGGRVRYTDLRDRNGAVLGDILGSDPVYVFQDDFGYGGGSSGVNGSSSYGAYVAGKTTPMLYAGANDGMLHGFAAPDCTSVSDCQTKGGGIEQLAYVPRGVYANLSALTDPGYKHRFYVDGPVGVGDAYFGTSWGTYLVGGLGAGGKSVYALDITNPTGFAATHVKWEFSDAADLGLTYGKLQIAPTTASQWGVIFGNGYNSTNERAYLYVVNLSGGSPLAKVATNTQDSNGLSMPYLHDRNGDKIPDVAYAGDLQGNLWKFVNDAGSWKLGNGNVPLYSAANSASQVQAITSQPKVAAHPSSGWMVYFGTGRYLTDADAASTEQQSFYAIWDRDIDGTVTQSQLQQQTITQSATFSGYSVRVTSNNTPDWATQRGWYMDLPVEKDASDKLLPAERVLSTPLVMEFMAANVPDRILFVTNTPTADPCKAGGTTWLMELDLITGARTASSVFDFTGDKKFDGSDMLNGDTAVSGIALPTSYGLTGEPLILETSNPEGGTLLVKEYAGSTAESGPGAAPLQQGEGSGAVQRIYWQQIQ